MKAHDPYLKIDIAIFCVLCLPAATPAYPSDRPYQETSEDGAGIGGK